MNWQMFLVNVLGWVMLFLGVWESDPVVAFWNYAVGCFAFLGALVMWVFDYRESEDDEDSKLG